MTVVSLDLALAPARAAALRAEREAIERRAWADMQRLREIRAELAAMDEAGGRRDG